MAFAFSSKDVMRLNCKTIKKIVTIPTSDKNGNISFLGEYPMDKKAIISFFFTRVKIVITIENNKARGYIKTEALAP
jgi:hypothetical protein